MVPITVGVAAPRGSVAYDSLSRALLASRGVYAVVGVSTETDSVDANRGVGVIVGFVLERTDATWIRRIRESGDRTPVIAICRPGLARFALAAGAEGIVAPEDDRLDLERAVAACSTGGRWIPLAIEQDVDRLELAPEPVAEPVAVAQPSPAIQPAPVVQPAPAPTPSPAAPVVVPPIAVAQAAAVTVATGVAEAAGIVIEEADTAEIAEIVAMARSRASA